jgi:hypothetical protein
MTFPTGPKIPNNRSTDRAGVGAAFRFFEANGCIFHEIPQQHDFGKDAYVDIAQDGIVTPICIALQIKSGNSYRTASGDYSIPLNQHSHTWRYSTVPVFGVVFDPDDQKLRWVDVTGYLRQEMGVSAGSVPIGRNDVLDRESLMSMLVPAAAKYAFPAGGSTAINLLSENDEIQVGAVFDAWALGRGDARYLILLRRVVLDLRRSATRRAIELLAHATPHPGIFWTKNNWILENIASQARESFIWSVAEIVHLFSALDPGEQGRGTLGQHLFSLLTKDRTTPENVIMALGEFVNRNDIERAAAMMITALHLVPDPRSYLARALRTYPEMRDDEWFSSVERALDEDNRFTLY